MPICLCASCHLTASRSLVRMMCLLWCHIHCYTAVGTVVYDSYWTAGSEELAWIDVIYEHTVNTTVNAPQYAAMVPSIDMIFVFSTPIWSDMSPKDRRQAYLIYGDSGISSGDYHSASASWFLSVWQETAFFLLFFFFFLQNMLTSLREMSITITTRTGVALIAGILTSAMQSSQ